jgi:hypothetical protein
MDTTYTIHTAAGTFQAEYGTGDWHNLTRGDTTTFQFGLSATNWETLQEYADYAGAYAPFELKTGDFRYREQIPSDADVNSILVGVEPNAELASSDVTGVWGVVDSGSDERPLSLTNDEYAIDVFVLAKFDEYADHATAEGALQV